MSDFTLLQMKTCKAILGIYETGRVGGDPSLLAVLADQAGISYGKHQATENGGNLWTLIYENYVTRDDVEQKEKSFFEVYRNLLYSKNKGHSGEKGFLTDNDLFKSRLIKLGKEDPAMSKAQDEMFHKEYFRPALELASEFYITMPLGLLQLYDLCIHDGPKGAAHFVEKFNDEWDEPEHLIHTYMSDEEYYVESEKAWIEGLIQHRHIHLSNYESSNQARQETVRQTKYRTASTLKLANERNWYFELPMNFVMVRDIIGYTNRHYLITEEVLENVW